MPEDATATDTTGTTSAARHDEGSVSHASHNEGARLIIAAFKAAQASGRDDWHRMTAAVLKNRMLAVTDRTFDESAWGAASFHDFLRQYADVIDLDTTKRPPIVELRDAAAAVARPTTTAVEGPRKRIRADLWHAVLDFTSGRIYVLRDGQAVALPPEEFDEHQDGPRLPTIDRETLASWRREFVKQQRHPEWPAETLQALDLWSTEQRSDWTLPRALRRQWNAELKRHVLATLDEWSAKSHSALPSDTVAVISAAQPQSDTTGQLRDLVVRVIGAMTREELEELRLPPAALLRITE